MNIVFFRDFCEECEWHVVPETEFDECSNNCANPDNDDLCCECGLAVCDVNTCPIAVPATLEDMAGDASLREQYEPLADCEGDIPGCEWVKKI